VAKNPGLLQPMKNKRTKYGRSKVLTGSTEKEDLLLVRAPEKGKKKKAGHRG